MDSAEYAGWLDHIKRYPPAESLIATLWITLASALSMGKVKVDPAEMGEWLESGLIRERRLKAAKLTETVNLSRAVAEAHKRSLDDAGGKTT